MTAAKHKQYTLGDNPATMVLTEQVVILRALISAMTTVAAQRESEIERLQELVTDCRTFAWPYRNLAPARGSGVTP